MKKSNNTKAVKVRINHERVEALHEILRDLIEGFEPEDAHEELLKEYMTGLKLELQKMASRQQLLYTFTMSGTEAIAFRQMWQMTALKENKYASIIVQSIIGQIDKYQSAA